MEGDADARWAAGRKQTKGVNNDKCVWGEISINLLWTEKWTGFGQTVFIFFILP